jgi:hypothetical protein
LPFFENIKEIYFHPMALFQEYSSDICGFCGMSQILKWNLWIILNKFGVIGFPRINSLEIS